MSESPESSTAARVRRWVTAALLGYWCLIFTLTHIPIVPTGLPTHSDKVAHLLMYLGLGFLLAWWFYNAGRVGVRLFVTVIFVAAVYAALDELLQKPVGRTADIRDSLADIAGAILGFACFLITRAVIQRRQKR
ncbi:MAG: VanZ family protein [Planctomycetaceae bacterium]|nr:VanZ family protein [Planctomycetaceae bacterium]MBT6156733.1 VanZ family protein [Planctomycetaceae bacterium]MBT6486024.1 VanZ family protein [Planctomycetaceae bacterium]MBT6496379.1 VanZ family protein [Planctomycetaceae bacterium]